MKEESISEISSERLCNFNVNRGTFFWGVNLQWTLVNKELSRFSNITVFEISYTSLTYIEVSAEVSYISKNLQSNELFAPNSKLFESLWEFNFEIAIRCLSNTTTCQLCLSPNSRYFAFKTERFHFFAGELKASIS